MKRKWRQSLVALLALGLLSATDVIAGDDSITGTVAKTEQGTVITSENGDTYIVMGKDLSAMVGKTLKVTGTLTENEAGKVITLKRIKPIE